jgi:hypothetical protein
MKSMKVFLQGKSSSQGTSLEFSPPLLGLMPLWVGPHHSTKYLGKRTSPVQNYKMVGFGMGEGLHGRAFCRRKYHRWFLMRSSWFAVWSLTWQRPCCRGLTLQNPTKWALYRASPHKAHFAGVAFLHLSQLASTLFQKKKKKKKEKKSQYAMVRFDNQSWILFVRV